MGNYDFVIVGGGMNGVNLAIHFLRQGVAANKIMIIDRHRAPILLWFEMTRQVGMEQVRSPLDQHLGGGEDSLIGFFSRRQHSIPDPYNPRDPYRRPTLRAFNAYLRTLLAKYRVHEVFQQGFVTKATPEDDGGFTVSFTKGSQDGEAVSCHTAHLLLAVGYHDNRFIPTWNQTHKISTSDHPHCRWIQELKTAGADIYHIYEPAFDVDKIARNKSTIVVGGGFSGVQLALKLAEVGEKVTLLIEYPIEVHYFDADPAWSKLSSAEMKAFLKQDLATRRRMIGEARNQGSISPELKEQLDDAIINDKIRLVLGDTKTAHYQGGTITLHVTHDDGHTSDISADRVILATGYRLKIRPGGAWIDELQKNLELPVHDGYPILDDQTLQWGTHQLYVAGQLAELSLGPLARNIAGTQLSAHHIALAPSIRQTLRRYNFKGVPL